VIEQLAEEYGWPTAVVADVYWSELARLSENAKVDTYLNLLTERRVREALHS